MNYDDAQWVLQDGKYFKVIYAKSKVKAEGQIIYKETHNISGTFVIMTIFRIYLKIRFQFLS